jgi:hypothetical protein
MLAKKFFERIPELKHHRPNYCQQCLKKAEIMIIMTGYSTDDVLVQVCRSCALQLARKLLEDVCDLDGDRHG